MGHVLRRAERVNRRERAGKKVLGRVKSRWENNIKRDPR